MKLLLAFNPRAFRRAPIAHPNVKLTACAICEASYDELRAHCPACGSRRNFLANHSFEPTRVVVRAMNQNQREVVRAFRSDIAFKFIVQ